MCLCVFECNCYRVLYPFNSLLDCIINDDSDSFLLYVDHIYDLAIYTKAKSLDISTSILTGGFCLLASGRLSSNSNTALV